MLADLFRCFRQGAAWLLAFPAWTGSLTLLGVLLGALSPWLEMRAKLPAHPVTSLALGAVTSLPLALYALPLFMLRLDAERDDPANPRSAWRATFEARWLPTLGAKLMVGLAVGIGLLMLLVPGLMVLAAFGWAPTLVLLRGFDLRRAARGSLRIMAVHGPRVIVVALGAFLLNQIITLAFLAALPFQEPELPALLRLKHPLLWALNGLTTLLGLWLSATLLALFHTVEAPAHAPEATPRR